MVYKGGLEVFLFIILVIVTASCDLAERVEWSQRRAMVYKAG